MNCAKVHGVCSCETHSDGHTIQCCECARISKIISDAYQDGRRRGVFDTADAISKLVLELLHKEEDR